MSKDEMNFDKVSTETLEYELRKRKALELKKQYEEGVTLGRFLFANREVLVQLAQLTERHTEAEFLSDESNFWGQPLIVDFSVREDDALSDRCYSHNGSKAVWEEFID